MDAEQARLDRLLNLPKVRKRLAGDVKISREFDIPYFAGYSRDGRTIYVDRSFTGKIPAPLVRHERVEKALIDAMGWSYAPAHRMATLAEHREVKDVAAYEAMLRPAIAAARARRPMRIPADLDLTPYRSDRKLLREMAAARAAN